MVPLQLALDPADDPAGPVIRRADLAELAAPIRRHVLDGELAGEGVQLVLLLREELLQ